MTHLTGTIYQQNNLPRRLASFSSTPMVMTHEVTFIKVNHRAERCSKQVTNHFKQEGGRGARVEASVEDKTIVCRGG